MPVSFLSIFDVLLFSVPMHLIRQTTVDRPLAEVWAGFDLQLFDRLSPPFPPVSVVRFDGCLRGDVVRLRLNFLLFQQDWTSLIVDQQTTADEIFFVDEGTQLPFFLRAWQHRHRLLARTGPAGQPQTVIIDDITFQTPNPLTDWLFYPLLWGQFAYRQPIYRRYFNRKPKSDT
jgi:ligand-binding SRPBCC domain-containing protein